jgi:hypothetical protein
VARGKLEGSEHILGSISFAISKWISAGRSTKAAAPFSTWRTLHIRATSPRTAELLGEKFEPSPSLTRVLKYPETGFYAKELLLEFRGSESSLDGFADAFEHGNLVQFRQFLTHTPQLETIRCCGRTTDWNKIARFPMQLLASLSSLASLRSLLLGRRFDMDFGVSPSFPPLHQVRNLQYYHPSGPTYGKPLFLSMPNLHTLYLEGEDNRLEQIISDIEVGCRFPPTFLLRDCLPLRILSLSFSLSDKILFGFCQSSAVTLRQNLEELTFHHLDLDIDDFRRISDSLRGGKLRLLSSLSSLLIRRDDEYEIQSLFNKDDFPCFEQLYIPPGLDVVDDPEVEESVDSEDSWDDLDYIIALDSVTVNCPGSKGGGGAKLPKMVSFSALNLVPALTYIFTLLVFCPYFPFFSVLELVLVVRIVS